MMRIRRSLFRFHVWLGWLVGVPLLLWTVSGLVMVARPHPILIGFTVVVGLASVLAILLMIARYAPRRRKPPPG